MLNWELKGVWTVEEQKRDIAEEYRQLGQSLFLGGWVQSELKDIRQEIRDVRLELKAVESSLRQEILGLRQEIGGLRQESKEETASLRQAIGAVESSLRHEIFSLRQESKEETASSRQEMEQKLNGLQGWVIATLLTVAVSTVGSALFLR